MLSRLADGRDFGKATGVRACAAAFEFLTCQVVGVGLGGEAHAHRAKHFGASGAVFAGRDLGELEDTARCG